MTTSGFMGLVYTVLIGLGVLGLLYAARIGNSLKRNYGQLVASGFTPDHVLNGSVIVVFDEKQRKVAFVFSNAIKQYDYQAIAGWNWEWLHRDGKHTVDYIKFRLRDANFPMVKTRLSSTQAAEIWNAKIEAILG